MAQPPEQLPLFSPPAAPGDAASAPVQVGEAGPVEAGATGAGERRSPAAAPGSRAGARKQAGAAAGRPGRVGRKRAAAQLDLALARAPRVAVIEGGGGGSGHRRARLVALDGGAAPQRPLPTRDEITGALLQGLADLVAGRISVAAAAAIREAADHALRQLDAAERDPHATPRFVRAARALQELLPGR